jgi:serine/threonine protein kinase
LDESHANCVFKEYIELQEVGVHRLICDVCEFFIHWDKQMSSIYFCIVSTYYPRGDLSSYLAQQQKHYEVLDQSTIRIWLGEIIEALLFANRKNIWHGDLKPANIYLQDNGSHIVVGDFCVPSVLSDLKTHARCATHSQRWCAPELEHSTTSNSLGDVWAVGCICLQMLTTGLRGAEDITGRLDDVKYSKTGLDELLSLTDEFFKGTLLSFVRHTLVIDPKQRPTLTDIAQMKLVIACMTEANASRISDQQLDYPYKPLPQIESVVSYMKYILDNLGNELCIGDALERLLSIIKLSPTPSLLDIPKKKIVIKAMNLHLAIERVVILGLELLNSQLVTLAVDASDYLYTPEALEVVTAALRRHPTSASVQNGAAALLTAAVVSEKAVEMMQNHKIYVDLVATLRHFTDNAEVCTSCMSALWSLMASGGNVRYLAEQKVVTDVVTIMKRHKTNVEVLQAAFCMILGLALQDENMKLIKSSGCVDVMIEALNGFSYVPQLARNGCLALAAIVEADEEMAYHMLVDLPDLQTTGVNVITDVYAHNRHTAAVVDSICSLLIELSHYEDIASDLEYMKLDDKLLKPIRKLFKDNAEVLAKCNTVAANMRSVKPLQNVAEKNQQSTNQ